MPRRSKVELSPETIKELEEQFYTFLHSLSPEETNKFFKEFLTTEEKMMMYKRLALYWSLFEGYSLASIQRMLGITHDTTRIYNKRKNEMSQDFKNLLHRIGRDGNGEPMKETVVEEMETKVQDAPVVVEETITVVEEVMAQEPQKEEEMTEENKEEKHEEMETKAENEEVHQPFDKAHGGEHVEPQAQDEGKEEQMETKSEDEEEENKEDENPEKKKKGFGRFFGF